MNFEEYNAAVKTIVAEQQDLAQETGKLCMSGNAHVMNPDFVKLLNRQGMLVQQLAKLNAEAMLGIGMPKL